MTPLGSNTPIAAPAAAAAVRTPWNQFRRHWMQWLSGRPEDHLIAGLWTARESLSALYLGLLLLLLLPVAIGLRLGTADTPTRLVLVATAVAAVFSASEVEVQRRARSVSLLPLIGGLLYGLAVTAVYAAVLWSSLPGVWQRHVTVFLVYPLLFFATGLRGDPRLCVATGLFGSLGFLAAAGLAPGFAAGDVEKVARLARELDPINLGVQLSILVCTTAFGALNASRERSLRRIAHCDALTGLIAADAFERCLAREADRAVRTGLGLTLALIDLDRFRQLNDTYGHAFGDTILRWVAELLRESVRTTDLIGRLSGERFGIAFLDSDHPALVGRLEALRREVSALSIRRDGLAEPVRLTLSAGLARFPREGTQVDEVLAVAQRRLHAAKRAGRDRVVA